MADPRPTVLAIDDEPVILKLITTHLELQGYRVVTAEGGQQGLRLIEQEQPAVVLLDVAMPDLDGFETLQQLRAVSHVPVIMLTAMDSYEDRVRGLELGADDYVVKPFSLGELAARIRALLRRSQRR